MTVATMLQKFQNMVDDVIDQEFMLQILNDAKNEIEGLQIWEQLKAVDSSQTAIVGATSTTTHPLPTKFNIPVAMYLGTDYSPYTQVNFEEQRAIRSNSRAFVIDLANSVYFLTGTIGTTQTIYFYYTKYTDDLTINDTWGFPTRFHDLIPLKMAQMYYAFDAGEKFRAWDDRWGQYYEKRLGDLVRWDAQMKNRAKNNNVLYGASLHPDPLVAFY